MSLGGRIRDNFYHWNGNLSADVSCVMRANSALQLVKHGIVKPVIEHETLEFTAAGRKLDRHPSRASCDDPDKYGRFHDFSMTPPAIPLKEAANVEAWLMDFFGRLKGTLASLSDEKASVAD